MPEQVRPVVQQPKATGIPVHVQVHAEADDRNCVYFWHDWGFENGPSKGKGSIELPHKCPETPIHFHLHDHTNFKLKFMDKSEDCMWVSTGKCPGERMNEGGQITFPDADSAPNLLKVSDRNAGPECILNYALCFDGLSGHQASDPGKACPPYNYDPEIKNGGGNSL